MSLIEPSECINRNDVRDIHRDPDDERLPRDSGGDIQTYCYTRNNSCGTSDGTARSACCRVSFQAGWVVCDAMNAFYWMPCVCNDNTEGSPTPEPSTAPIALATSVPTSAPVAIVTAVPTTPPVVFATIAPVVPTSAPVVTTTSPTKVPSTSPTRVPTVPPTPNPTRATEAPVAPVSLPTVLPTPFPTTNPTMFPTISSPKVEPVAIPFEVPTTTQPVDIVGPKECSDLFEYCAAYDDCIRTARETCPELIIDPAEAPIGSPNESLSAISSPSSPPSDSSAKSKAPIASPTNSPTKHPSQSPSSKYIPVTSDPTYYPTYYPTYWSTSGFTTFTPTVSSIADIEITTTLSPTTANIDALNGGDKDDNIGPNGSSGMNTAVVGIEESYSSNINENGNKGLTPPLLATAVVVPCVLVIILLLFGMKRRRRQKSGMLNATDTNGPLSSLDELYKYESSTYQVDPNDNMQKSDRRSYHLRDTVKL